MDRRGSVIGIVDPFEVQCASSSVRVYMRTLRGGTRKGFDHSEIGVPEGLCVHM